MMSFSPARYSLKGYSTVRETTLLCVEQWHSQAAGSRAEQSLVSIVGHSFNSPVREHREKDCTLTVNGASVALILIILHFIALKCFFLF